MQVTPPFKFSDSMEAEENPVTDDPNKAKYWADTRMEWYTGEWTMEALSTNNTFRESFQEKRQDPECMVPMVTHVGTTIGNTNTMQCQVPVPIRRK